MKDTYIRIRLSERDKDLIRQQAEAVSMSMSEYIIDLVRRQEDKSMKMYVADRETGTFIEEVASVSEGKKLISQYENTDSIDGTYEPNFYDIVDGNHMSLI